MDRWRTWNAQKLPGRAVNRYVRGWLGHGNALAAIEVHRTACIVTHPPSGEKANHALVNPANETLVGTQFTPDECWRNLHGDPTTGRWDKDFVVYPTQAVDGLVTEFGGEELRIALEAKPVDAQGRRCPVGSAVLTPATFELRELYDNLIHAVPPFYRMLAPSEWSELLCATYKSVFDTAHRAGFATLALPLLGAGARGAPKAEAMRVAAEAAVSWRSKHPLTPPIARFGVQDSTTAHELVAALEDAMLRAGDSVSGFEAKPSPPPERWSLTDKSGTRVVS